MGPPGQVLEDYVNFPQTFRKTFEQISHVSGPKKSILTKFINDSASFLPEKLNNHVMFTKKHNI